MTRSRILISAVLAATMGITAAGPALAQGPGPQHDMRDARHDLRDARQDRRQADRDVRQARQDIRHARHDNRVYRGATIPREYRAHQYVVNDWRNHRLSAPPRGYEWVRVGSNNTAADYALIAVATGLIANLVLSQ